MLNRRLFLGGLCASLPVIALPGALRAQSRPRLHAMVVGINRYTGQGPSSKIPDLEGCINDANDIARQVMRLDSNVRALGVRNEPVTRATFFSAWQSMLSAARTGDTLLLTYSGHGGQVAEACARNETDGLDETLILTGLDVSQNRGNAEHIIDDELAALWGAAAARGLHVIFVADSCFSGTVYRNVELTDRRRYRTIRAYQLAPGGGSRVSCQTRLPEEPPNLLFLAGSQEDQVVPEMDLNGVAHGALSVAVARALEGGADTNRDGVITGDELTQFVLSYVESLADSNQHPLVRWHGTRSTPIEMVGGSTRGVLVDLKREETPTVAIKAPSEKGPPPPPRIGSVRLQIRGLAASERPRIASSLTNATIVGETEPASLIWDAARQLVFNGEGQRMAEGVGAGQLQHVVDRRRLLEHIIQMSVGRSLSVRIHLPGETAAAPPSVADVTHRPRPAGSSGHDLNIFVSGVTDGHYFAVFNLTGNGQVQLLDPRLSLARKGEYLRARGGAINPIDVDVQEPFGADHVVVVAGQHRLNHLLPAVVRGHTQFAAAAVLAALEREAAVQPLQAGFKGIYTAPA